MTEARILIVGIGAIGSMVATTLVRGGCKQLTIIDQDAKVPSNVCRSEYAFYSGIDDKVSELRTHLCRISPFVEVSGNTSFGDVVKGAFDNDDAYFEQLKKWLETYKVIIDCSTGNDLAYLFSRAAPRAILLNLSITNHVKELVCTMLPDAYEWMMDIFPKLENDTTDLYNPTGCWSPMFKASYNDVAVLVQYAIKHINQTLERGQTLHNFYSQPLIGIKGKNAFNYDL